MQRKYFLKPDRPDDRDLIYAPMAARPGEELPESVDLRQQMSPVVDQGSLGSCTANAIGSGLREYLEIKKKQPLIPLSRLFLYYQERLAEGTVDEDAGAEIRDGMKVLRKIGICPESDWPYDISKYTHEPTEEAKESSAKFKISEFHRVTDLNSVKMALADGLPVVSGIKVFESFESPEVANTGIVPGPKPQEEFMGGHAVLAVGYEDVKGWLIVRNSWGTGWGDKGYFYLPYLVFETIIMDMWTGH